MKASEGAAIASPTEVRRAAAKGESFSLRPGETASVDGDSLLVGFIKVTTDSRCPRGEQCLWAGDATVRVFIQAKRGSREEREISLSGKEPPGGSADEVRLVSLEPQPVSGRPNDPGDYVATLQVAPQRAAPR